MHTEGMRKLVEAELKAERKLKKAKKKLKKAKKQKARAKKRLKKLKVSYVKAIKALEDNSWKI